MRFVKMHGIGNDFVCVDCFQESVDDPAGLARTVCDRHFGVGGDGLILICPPSGQSGTDPSGHAHVRMRVFNADGSEPEMCGNGIRCAAKYAHDHGLNEANPLRVETIAGTKTIELDLDDAGKVVSATVDMGEPILEPKEIPIELPRTHAGLIVDFPLGKYIPMGAAADWMAECELDMRMTCVSMGNPHMVIYCGRVEAAPLETLGPFLGRQGIFPRQVNVHFAQVHSQGEVTMRTWERGAGVTLACGTGASSVCVAGVLTKRTDRKIVTHLPGGDLEIEWRDSDNHVYMTGPATEVFSGEWIDNN